MTPSEWMRSIQLTFGLRLDPVRDKDARSKLLLGCNVDKATGCWTSVKKMFALPGKRVNVQRAAYALFRGPLRDDQIVRSTCDNPKCCNVDHLTVDGFTSDGAEIAAVSTGAAAE